MAPAQLGGKQAGSLFLLPKVTWWPDFSALPNSAHPALCLLLSPTPPQPGRGRKVEQVWKPFLLPLSCGQRQLLQPLALLDSARP